MIQPAWSTVPLGDDAKESLRAIPAAPGVVQILGRDAVSLLIGRGTDMRRFAASHLGFGKPPAKGVRPPVSLCPIAEALRFVPTRSGFGQRLLYERLMGQHVPLEKRRDLKTPAYLRLDAAARFPRLEVVTEDAVAGVHGPFRDRAAAQRALAALHKTFPLRPCDFIFEPHPELPLGSACLYAQVRSCAAPCLSRVSEAEYRALAESAARLLSVAGREAEAATTLPPWIGPLDTPALVVEGVSGNIEVYPVRAGRVLDEQAFACRMEALPQALTSLDWSVPPRPSDLRWLSSWIHAPRRPGHFVRLPERDPEGHARAVRAALSTE